MKYLFKTSAYIFVLGTFLSTSVLGQETGDSFRSAKASKNANLTYIYAGVNGFANKGSDGELEGLYIQMMDAFEAFVLSKYGIAINSTYVPVQNSDFQQFLDNVKNSSGGVFGLNTTTIKEERKAFLKFSPAVLNNISVLISHRTIPKLSSMSNISSEFSGFTAYTASGSTYHQRLLELKGSSYPDIKINMVASEYDIIESVAKDPKSFAFIDISFYLEYLMQKKPVTRHPVGDQGGEQYGIIMPLNSDWDPILAEFLNSGFLKSSEYRQIVINNLGKGALRMLD